MKSLVKWTNALRGDLEKLEIPVAQVYQLTEDAVRYVKQYYADIGMHRQAFVLAQIQNSLRTDCLGALGRKFPYRIGRLNRFVHGYCLSWVKVLRSVALFYALTCTSLLSFWYFSGEHAIVFTGGSGDPVCWYHYPYFTLVTFATLGYGDLAPNIDAPCGMIPAYISSMSAVVGIIALGFFLAVLVNRLGAHGIVRASRWFDDFEEEMNIQTPKHYGFELHDLDNHGDDEPN